MGFSQFERQMIYERETETETETETDNLTGRDKETHK